MKEFSSTCLLSLYEIHLLRQLCWCSNYFLDKESAERKSTWNPNELCCLGCLPLPRLPPSTRLSGSNSPPGSSRREGRRIRGGPWHLEKAQMKALSFREPVWICWSSPHWWIRAGVPNIFGTRDWFCCGRQFYHGLVVVGGWFGDDSSALLSLCTLFLI